MSEWIMENTDEAVIKIEGLNKKLGGFSLNNIDLAIPKGYITGFIGRNGAGKTTTIKAILNMLKPDSGKVEVFGLDAEKHEAEIKSRLGIVIGESGLLGDMKAGKLAKKLEKLYDKWDDRLFKEYTSRFGVDLDKKISEFSTGTKMKLAICIALSHGAELYIFDEPTAGLDPVVRDEILDLLREIIRDEDKTVFFSTHITSDLDKIADYIVLIESGRIVFNSEKDELIEEYRVIKGSMSALTPELKEKTLRYEESGYGFKGLIKAVDIPRGDRGYVIERPNVEEIMLAKWKLDRGE